MADLSDVTAYLLNAVGAAVYPNGSSNPAASVANLNCRIFEGWPLASLLDSDMAAGNAQISIFPMQGTGKTVYQILDKTYTVTPPSYGLSVSVSGDVITVSGQPKAGEYLTIVADRANIFSQTGANTQALLAALASQAQAVYPSASSTSTTLTIPYDFAIEVRQGAEATLGRVTHRQCHPVMISVWAPNRVARNKLASAIDVALKLSNKITLPDTSQALLIYNRTMVSDQEQADNIYRRDLIYDVDYATLELFPGYVITSVTTTIEAVGNGNAESLAIT